MKQKLIPDLLRRVRPDERRRQVDGRDVQVFGLKRNKFN